MPTTTALKTNIRKINDSLVRNEKDSDEIYHDKLLKSYQDVTTTIPSNKHISSYMIAAKVREVRKEFRSADNPRYLHELPTEVMADFNEARKHGIWCLYDDDTNRVIDSDLDNVKDVVNDYKVQLQANLDKKYDKAKSLDELER